MLPNYVIKDDKSQKIIEQNSNFKESQPVNDYKGLFTTGSVFNFAEWLMQVSVVLFAQMVWKRATQR